MSENNTRISPQRRGCPGSRGGRGSRGVHGRTQGRSYNQNNRTTKFKGNSTDLEGYTFNCSDYKQAEKYVSTIKRITEYYAQNTSMAVTSAAHLRMKCGSQFHSW